MTTPNRAVVWSALLASWDRQQAGYMRFREERFSVIVQALGDHLGTRFSFLDLGCGPGSLTQRILDAHPLATAICVDTDPVLLAIAEQTLSPYGERARIVDVDLRSQEWTTTLGVTEVEAAVSTTALHWLMPEDLLAVYNAVGRLLPEGGMILNGDHFAFDGDQVFAKQLAEADKDRWKKEVFSNSEALDWPGWWREMEAVPELQSAFVERTRRNAAAPSAHGATTPKRCTNLALHTLCLKESGCNEVTTIWQHFDDRVLMGVKGKPRRSGCEDVRDQVMSYWNDPTRARDYDKVHPVGYDMDRTREAWKREFANVLPPAPVDVLDLGCGPGFVSLNLAEMGYRVHGIDNAERMLERARREAVERGVDATFERGDAGDPPGEDNSYDVVVSRYLFWTLADPSAALRNSMRLARPGGLIAVFDGPWFANGHNRTEGLGNSWYELWSDVYHAKTRNNLPLMERNHADTLVALFRSVGLLDVETHPLAEVRTMRLETVGTAEGEGNTYAVWGRVPSSVPYEQP